MLSFAWLNDELRRVKIQKYIIRVQSKRWRSKWGNIISAMKLKLSDMRYTVEVIIVGREARSSFIILLPWQAREYS